MAAAASKPMGLGGPLQERMFNKLLNALIPRAVVDAICVASPFLLVAINLIAFMIIANWSVQEAREERIEREKQSL